MLKQIKRGALAVSKRAGLFHALRRSDWRRNRLTILCYHGVSILDEHEWNSSYYMSPSAFEDRLRRLRDGGYAVLPLGDALAGLREGTLPAGSVSLTFDDGMYDFYSKVYPLLRTYDVPATVYLTTYYSDFNRPVFGVFCSYLLWRGRHRTLDLGELVPGAGRFDLATETARRAARGALDAHAAHTQLDARQKDALAARLAQALGVDYDELIARRVLHVMNNEEVSELAARGIDFQLHTHRHRVPVDRPLFLREIDDNRTRIRELAGNEAVHFCYPSGVYREEFFPWLGEVGVASATTCETGLATAATPPLLLPRIVDGAQLSPIEFEGWLSGACAFLPRRPRWAGDGVPE